MRRSPPRPCSGPPSLIPPFITASLLFPPLRCPFLSSWTTGKTGWEIGCLKPSIPKSWSCKPLYYFFDLPVCLSSFLFSCHVGLRPPPFPSTERSSVWSRLMRFRTNISVFTQPHSPSLSRCLVTQGTYFRASSYFLDRRKMPSLFIANTFLFLLNVGTDG